MRHIHAFCIAIATGVSSCVAQPVSEVGASRNAALSVRGTALGEVGRGVCFQLAWLYDADARKVSNLETLGDEAAPIQKPYVVQLESFIERAKSDFRPHPNAELRPALDVRSYYYSGLVMEALVAHYVGKDYDRAVETYDRARGLIEAHPELVRCPRRWPDVKCDAAIGAIISVRHDAQWHLERLSALQAQAADRRCARALERDADPRRASTTNRAMPVIRLDTPGSAAWRAATEALLEEALIFDVWESNPTLARERYYRLARLLAMSRDIIDTALSGFVGERLGDDRVVSSKSGSYEIYSIHEPGVMALYTRLLERGLEAENISEDPWTASQYYAAALAIAENFHGSSGEVERGIVSLRLKECKGRAHVSR
ncbi:MAG: hypothetical protein IPM64_11440 [Phycisphaerales bacterium]|nr:hypothetical protein [Phycisphaerales bacterium]